MDRGVGGAREGPSNSHKGKFFFRPKTPKFDESVNNTPQSLKLWPYKWHLYVMTFMAKVWVSTIPPLSVHRGYILSSSKVCYVYSVCSSCILTYVAICIVFVHIVLLSSILYLLCINHIVSANDNLWYSISQKPLTDRNVFYNSMELKFEQF